MKCPFCGVEYSDGVWRIHTQACDKKPKKDEKPKVVKRVRAKRVQTVSTDK